MDSFASFLSTFVSWVGRVWRGEAYSLLSRQIAHERQEANKREVELKQRITCLEKQVETILNLSGELLIEKISGRIESLKQRIEHCEEKIDSLVYELYNLDSEEIKMIEGDNS